MELSSQEDGSFSFSGRANVPLAEEIARTLGCPWVKSCFPHLLTARSTSAMAKSIRGADAFVVQSHSDAVNDKSWKGFHHDRRVKRTLQNESPSFPFYGCTGGKTKRPKGVSRLLPD